MRQNLRLVGSCIEKLVQQGRNLLLVEDWLWVFPRVVRAATGHNASYYMNRMHARLGLSKQFTFNSVDTNWFAGATGSCKDWARFGQLILIGLASPVL